MVFAVRQDFGRFVHGWQEQAGAVLGRALLRLLEDFLSRGIFA
jgi:hypothetical protein